MTEQQWNGLTAAQVLESREKQGVNVITPARKEPVWKLFLGKFNDPIIKILLVAAVLSLGIAFLDREFAETIGIFCAIFLATGVAFWYEYDARRRFEILNVVNDDTPVKVIRQGQVAEIPRRDVVVGDLVVLGTGDEIPADGPLLEAVSLRVNESTLTGEPLTGKTTDPEKFSPEATYPSDRALRGTTVVEGRGIMRVDAVGDATEFGRVAGQATAKSEEKTPLDKQLERLSRMIGRVGTALAVLVFLVLVVKGYWFTDELREGGWLHIAHHLLRYFMVSVAIMVMAIPEGLPMSITLSLAMSMRRMLRTGNLVRKMHACETMGAVTVICTDKTGTLTRNQMRIYRIDPYGDLAEGVFDESVAVNSTAFLDAAGQVLGNPTEGALLLWLRDAGKEYAALRAGAKIVDQMTFTTERKYMATLAESPVAGRRMLYVKGAPEIVREMCVPDGLEARIEERLRGYQNRAMRTLGFAVKETSAATCQEAIAGGSLRFVGIAAISDPVRDDVPEAVARCLNAGIDVKIVTGDTPATAREIARQIGLWNDEADGERNRITGVEFAALSDAELLDRVQELKIMSRARPLDKQRLVRLLQERGEVVAVTGDGTNDAPALNFAQVGLSMGSGTSVAKEASDITLLDDSFSSIATAVMWGRSLYKNIQRFVLFQLTVNFVALAVVFFGSIFGQALPLTVTQILWVNLIMDTFAAMALASLPPDPRVMEEPPRRSRDFLITRPMLRSMLITGSLFAVVLLSMLIWWGGSTTLTDPYHDPSNDEAIRKLSIFFTTFVLFQFWNLFNARAFDTRRGRQGELKQSSGFLLIQLCILAGQILIVTFGDGVFRTVPLRLREWLLILFGTSLIYAGGALCRTLKGRTGRKIR